MQPWDLETFALKPLMNVKQPKNASCEPIFFVEVGWSAIKLIINKDMQFICIHVQAH